MKKLDELTENEVAELNLPTIWSKILESITAKLKRELKIRINKVSVKLEKKLKLHVTKKFNSFLKNSGCQEFDIEKGFIIDSLTLNIDTHRIIEISFIEFNNKKFTISYQYAHDQLDFEITKNELFSESVLEIMADFLITGNLPEVMLPD